MHRTLSERFVWMADPIKGSKFEAWLGPAGDEPAALALLEEARRAHPNATHHCWAYVLADGRTRSSDDGEPGGSAGRPILAQLEGHGVADVMAVVVRWYGGTNLGVGGLIRAYGGTAGKALDRAPLVEVHALAQLTFQYAYGDTQAVDAVLAQVQPEVLERAFDTRITCTVRVPLGSEQALRDALSERTGGRVRFAD